MKKNKIFLPVAWPLDQIKPYENNPRTHPDSQITFLATLLRKYGVDQPIVIDEHGVILKGHGRRLAALQAGFKDFPVVVHKGLSDTDKRALRIADNQSALLSGWDDKLMKSELAELSAAGFELLTLGFDSKMLDSMLDSEMPEAEVVPEKPKRPVVMLGDLWTLGSHRVLCGDCTSAEDVAVALGKHKPHLMVTDPPYGVEYDADWRNSAQRANGKPFGGRAVGKVNNDHRVDWSEAWALFEGDVAYVWHGALHVADMVTQLKAKGLEGRALIVWAKNNFAVSRGHYHWQHETCWYVVRRGKTAHWSGDRGQTTLWNIPKPQKSETGHSTQKPIECMKRPIENNSERGDFVYDPFVGSGTTIIAAEVTDRKCLAIDIDPGYVQVSIERWQTLTGKVATLGDKPFNEIAKERRHASRHSGKSISRGN